MTTMNPLAADYKARVDAIDLESVKFRLMRDDNWTRAQADAVEPLYKGYLLLTAIGADHALIPTKGVDMMWHMHILDTQKYAADCQAAFGHFVHHVPERAERTPEQAVEAADAFNRTKGMLREVLGFDLRCLQAAAPSLCQPDALRLTDASICQGKGDGGAGECHAGIRQATRLTDAAICQGKGDGGAGECHAGISPATRYSLIGAGICQGKGDGGAGECHAGIRQGARLAAALS